MKTLTLKVPALKRALHPRVIARQHNTAVWARNLVLVQRRAGTCDAVLNGVAVHIKPRKVQRITVPFDPRG